MREKPVEDLAIALSGILLAPTYPRNKDKKAREEWFQKWFGRLRREVLKGQEPFSIYRLYEISGKRKKLLKK